MKKILLTIFSLGIILLFASCGNDNNSVNYDEEYKFDHHVHEIDESKTVHHDANCLHDEFDEYFCECGKRYGYSNSREYDSSFKGTNINHTFVNGVCTKCGCEESPFEIELISPTTCRIVYFTMEENDDVVIPDQIYGLDVVEVSINNEYYNGKFKIIKKLNSLTIGKNIKKMNIAFRYSEWLENVTDETKIDGRVTERFTNGGINYAVVEHITEIGEVNFTSTIQDFVNIEFMGYWSNPLIGAKKATINGEDIKNLVLPDDIDLSNSSYTFGGKYIESITLPDNLSTMGKYTFDFESMNDSVFNTDSNGISYLKSKSNDKYMLAKFSDNSGNITIDSNVKMIYGPAWSNCKYNKVTINDNVNYFTDIGSYNGILNNKDEYGYEVFKGEIEYTGTLNNWFKKEFLRYRNIDFSDRYLQVPSKQGDIWDDIHNPVYLASKFSCGGTVLKELNDANNYKDITLTIPEVVEKTNNFALEGCKFTKIYIPKSIRVIGTKSIGTITGKPIENLGNNETAFPSVYYAGSISDWLNIYFDSFLANPFVDGDTSAWNNKFYVNNNELVSNLVIPEGVEEIKTAQFAGINSIVSISFPSTLKYIDDFAFSRCQNIYNNQGEYGINNIVKKLLESKSGGTEYHYLEDANLDLEKLNEELPNRKFDIVIPKNVNYIGLCAFETYVSGFHIYIPKEVEYVSTYALCIGRDPDYYGRCYNPHLYTDRDNAEDSKWGFKQEMDYDGELLKVALNYYPYNQCNVSMDDIIVDNYNYYKKIDNDTLLPIAVYDVEGIVCNIYTEGTDEPIFKSKKDNYYNYYDYVVLIDGIEIGDKNYNTNIDFNYINFISYYDYHTYFNFYITRDVTSVDFGEVNVSHLEFYFEGTEDEWNNICSNKNINVTFNCTLVPSNQQ